MAIEICEVIVARNQYQLKIQGTLMFPCACYFSDIKNYVTGSIPAHWHEEVEVIVVNSGTMNMNINGINFILKKGEGAFINSNVLHSMQLIDNSNCILNTVVFHPSLISGAAESVFMQRYVHPLLKCDTLPCISFYSEIEWHRQAIHCIQEAYDCYSKEEFGYELIVREKLSHMWYLIVKNMVSVLNQQNQNVNPNIVRVKTMLDFLHHNYDKPLDLQQIASAVNVSDRECLRCFQKTVGISPIQYLLKYRISVASHLLENTDIPITELCNRVGFDNPSYFSKIFKRFMYFTPSDYRKQQKTDR